MFGWLGESISPSNLSEGRLGSRGGSRIAVATVPLPYLPAYTLQLLNEVSYQLPHNHARPTGLTSPQHILRRKGPILAAQSSQRFWCMNGLRRRPWCRQTLRHRSLKVRQPRYNLKGSLLEIDFTLDEDRDVADKTKQGREEAPASQPYLTLPTHVTNPYSPPPPQKTQPTFR